MSGLFESENQRSTPRSAHGPRDEFALLELTGEDRIEWLQGQATNDVRPLAEAGGRASFCFCEPTGGMIAVIDAWALANKVLMVTPKACLPAVLNRVEQMVILEDVAAREVPFEELDVSDSEASRLEAGIPRWGADMGPKTLPPEMGAAFESRYVSYNKGCYTGQEVLMRIHARGHTNRTWVGLIGKESLNVGDAVTFEGKPVGTVTSVAHSATFGYLAAATLRNEAAVEGQIVTVGETEAVVRQMPILRSA